MKLEKTTSIISLVLLALMLYSCANIGRPTGGPRDELPPVFVSSSPKPNQLNFNGNKVIITFNEYIKLEEQNTKVVVSPAQKNMPIIRANGKSVSVELRDSLLPNTTYSIDFSDAIVDNNESNPLMDFAIAFSTGDSIDSLQVSGMMLRARDLEPMQGTIVGIQEDLSDTAFSSKPLTRVARTNDAGEFTIRNLKPGRYRVFGLKDMDGNYTFSRNEDLAFFDEIVVPSFYTKETTDTIFKFNGEVDTIQPGLHTVFTPNDVLLTMFNEEYMPLYLKKDDRPSESKLHILFSAPVDTLPELRVLKPAPQRPDWYRLQRDQSNDSLFYWITDSTLIKSDSILIEAKYLISDSLDNLVQTTDTINFFFRHKGKKQNKSSEKNNNKSNFLTKLTGQLAGEKNDSADNKPKSMFDSITTVRMSIPMQLEYGDTLKITFDTPIDSVNQAGLKMMHKEHDDTTWHEIDKPYKLVPYDSISILTYRIDYPFDAGMNYKIQIDSLSIYDCYGSPNKTQKAEFSVPAFDEYANLYLTVNVNDSAFVELLNSSEKLVKKAPVINGVASIENIKPGPYFARLVIDRNNNGEWDTGNFAQKLQPEEVYYYNEKISLRKNWDVEQTWDIYSVALNKQKPFEIKKNRTKAEIKKHQKDRQQQQDDDEFNEDDPWGTNNYNNPYTGNKYNDSRNNMGVDPGNRVQLR